MTYKFILSFCNTNFEQIVQYLKDDYYSTIRYSIIPDLSISDKTEYTIFYLCEIRLNNDKKLIEILSIKKFPLE